MQVSVDDGLNMTCVPHSLLVTMLDPPLKEGHWGESYDHVMAVDELGAVRRCGE